MEIFLGRYWKRSGIWIYPNRSGFLQRAFGSGKLFGYQIIPDALYEMGYENNGLMLLSPMALITVGVFIWLQRSRNRKLIEKN